MIITGRLVALLALCTALAVAPSGVLWAAAGVLVCVALVDFAYAATIGDITVQRSPSAAVRLYESGSTTLTFRNVGRRTLRGLIADTWVPSAGAGQRPIPLRLDAGEHKQTTTALTPSRRGERDAVSVTIRSHGPLGLLARQRRIVVPGSIAVLPAFTSRRFLPEKVARLRLIEGAVLMRQRGKGSEFDSMREYVPGDDVRAIDWRATARHHDVIVRTWRPERDRHIILTIDTGRGSAARIGDEPRLDAAIDAALLLGTLAGRAGDKVGVVAADLAVRAKLAPKNRKDLVNAMATAMMPLEPALVETDTRLLIAQTLGLSARRSLVVLFTNLDDANADALLNTAVALQRRHKLVVASVDDHRLLELAQTRGTTEEVLMAAAAELAMGAREAVADRLRALGVHVVRAPEATFASQVADAYLDLKAAGQL